VCYFTHATQSFTLKNNLERKMTKFETKQSAIIETNVAIGNTVSAARMLSSLIRVARTDKSRRDLIALAEGLRLAGHPEFRI
jgi:hypothetical protein